MPELDSKQERGHNGDAGGSEEDRRERGDEEGREMTQCRVRPRVVSVSGIEQHELYGWGFDAVRAPHSIVIVL